MSGLKQQISAPIEAGRSILDANNLPSRLSCMLEYVSKRLTRKSLHLTLVVVKDEHQLPTTPPCATPTTPPLTPDHSTSGPSSPSYFSSPVSGLKRLVRRGTSSSSASSNSSTSAATAPTTETNAGTRRHPTTPPPISTDHPTSPRRWLPSGTSQPSTPMTPHTPLSFTTSTTGVSSCGAGHRFQSPDSYWMRLVHTSPISAKDDKIIRATMMKAERKFQTRPGELPTITTASASGLNADLIRRSLRQNEVLFSSEGLTLLALDRLYSFKAALTAYAKSLTTPSPRIRTPAYSPGLSNHPVKLASPPPTPGISYSLRLEDAVDSLRRLILSNGDRPVPRADLYRSFDWMGVNPTALADVERMYKRAYGGPEQRGPFETPPPIVDEEVVEPNREARQKRMGFIKLATPPPPKGQAHGLRVNTNLCTNSAPDIRLMSPLDETRVDESYDSGRRARRRINEDELAIKIDSWHIEPEPEPEPLYRNHKQSGGGHVAHPIPDGRPPQQILWLRNNSLATTIDEVLVPYEEGQLLPLGPRTPNKFDDLSPTTIGEWGFLFKGGTWTQPRTAAIETC